MSIYDNLILTSFSAPAWSGKVRDAKATKKIQNEFNIKRKAGDFYKKLMPQYVDDIQSSITRARVFHYENTLPYDRKGRSILMTTNYFNYVEEMNKKITEINSKVEEFVSVWDREIQKDQEELGELFNIRDYPTKEELKSKYKVKVNFEPIPSSGNLMLNLETEELQKVREEVEKEVNERIELAVKDLGERLYKVVSHLHEKLNGDGRIFASVVENVQAMCNLIPRLNINNDPKIEELRKEIEEKLCFFSVDTLKENEQVRKNVVENAESILKRLSGMY